MWPNPQYSAIWSHLLKKSLMENFDFCVVSLIHGLIFMDRNERTRVYVWLKVGQLITQRICYFFNISLFFFNIFQYFFNSCNLWSFIVCTGETRCHFKDVIVNFVQLWLHSSIFLLNVSILFNVLALSKFLLRIDQTKL